jgi:chromate transporter
MREKPRVSLRELFTTFLIIGTTSFGGGMAAVAFIERVCVHEKKWLTHEEFMHGIAFGQILGPFSLNSSTFTGYYLRGVAGGVAAAVGFIAPSFFLVSLLSWLYFRFHELPQLESAMEGTNPVVVGLILVAALGMARKIRGAEHWLIAILAFLAASFFGINGLTVLVVTALWALGRAYYRREYTT